MAESHESSSSGSSEEEEEWSLKEGMFFHTDNAHEGGVVGHEGFDATKPLALSVYIKFIDDFMKEVHADIYFAGTDKETGEPTEATYVTTSLKSGVVSFDTTWKCLVPIDDRYWLLSVRDETPLCTVSPRDYLHALTLNRIFGYGINKAIKNVQKYNARRQKEL
jgi:hypothetical protein